VDVEVERRVLWHTLLKPPEDLGVTQWSSRLLARRVNRLATAGAATGTTRSWHR
jgi:hypothetical protein